MKPSRLHEDEQLMEEWLEYVTTNPLPACLNYYDYDHIAGVFSGHVPKEVIKELPKARQIVEDDDVDDDGVVQERPKVVTTARSTPTNPLPDEGVTETTVAGIRARLAGRRAGPQAIDDEDDEAPPSRPARRG
jgi:hypothetical protein